MTTGWTAATDTEDLPPRYDFALSELFSYDYSHIFRISYYLGTQPIFLYFDHKMLIRLLQPGLGFPGGTSGKEPACQCRRCKWWEFDPWVRKIPWKKAQQPTPVGSRLENPMDRGAWWAHSWARRWDLTCRQPGPNLFVHSTYSTNICLGAILQLNRKVSEVAHMRDEQTSTRALNRKRSRVVHMRGEQTSTIAMSIADPWSWVNQNSSDSPLSSCPCLGPACPNFPPKSPLGLTLML